MQKFIKINTGASGMPNEGAYFCVDDIDKITYSAPVAVLSFKSSAASVSLKTSGVDNLFLANYLTQSKDTVLDIAAAGGNIEGIAIPALTSGSEVAGTAIATGADIELTLDGATVGLNYTATLTQGENVVSVSGVVADAAEVIVFLAADTTAFAAGAADFSITFSAANQPDYTYIVTEEFTLT